VFGLLWLVAHPSWWRLAKVMTEMATCNVPYFGGTDPKRICDGLHDRHAKMQKCTLYEFFSIPGLQSCVGRPADRCSTP